MYTLHYTQDPQYSQCTSGRPVPEDQATSQVLPHDSKQHGAWGITGGESHHSIHVYVYGLSYIVLLHVFTCVEEHV